MLNESLIATTALSSFNNAALFSPFFATVGLLTLPLLWIVYLYARNIESQIGWNNNQTLDNNVGFFSSLFLMLWVMLFGGNYAVIRDGISWLPILVGLVLFVSTAIVVRKSVLLGYMAKIKSKKIRLFIFFMFVLMAGVSGYGNAWTILVQISAVLCGVIVGLCVRKNISLVPTSVFLMTLMSVLVLMQPEFFRFGQLGNLTVVHLLAIVATGMTAITALTTRYIHARSRIYHSAYVKLKWLFRIASILALVLFVLTESVPVFLGLIGAVGALEALSIYHSKNISESMYKQSVACLLICVGTIIICPALAGVGVFYLATISKRAKFAEFMALL